jgi:putative ABC transport system permease protein
MPWKSLSYGLLRAVLSRDRAKAVLGDITEELAYRGAAGRRTASPGIRLIGHTAAFVAGILILAAGGKGRRMLIDDFRHVWRRLRARPAAAVITAAMLAAAIGLSTGTFAVLDSLVLERAPFAEPETLRTVAIGRRSGSGNPELIHMMRAWRAAASFAAVEAAGTVAMGDRSSPTSDTAALVTPGLFTMLGVRPIRGRGFTEEDARGQDVEPAVIAARLWRTSFGGDAKHLGNVITLHGRQYRLIGVMPDDFRFPESTTVLWRPISFDATPFPAAAGRDAYVRLPSGIPEAEVMQRATHLAGVADGRFTARPNELVSGPIGGVADQYAGRAIPMFAGAVGLIFLSLCANASGLRLANMTERRRELGVRLSLGAHRRRRCRRRDRSRQPAHDHRAAVPEHRLHAFADVEPH